MSAIHACRSCGSTDLRLFLSLGKHPLPGALLSASDLQQPEQKHPLDVVFCQGCTLVQITETVPPETLFREYAELSSSSDTTLRHAKGLAENLLHKRQLGDKSLVVELASNDGYLLQHFVKAGVPVLGVEPARSIARVAEERGIRTVSEFFGSKLAKNLLSAGHRADVILANNVMAHVPDINGVVAGIKTLLKPDGVFIMQTPYVREMIESLAFDTLYHEHLYCHSLTALEHLFRRHELSIAEVEWVPVRSIRVSVVHAGREGERQGVRKMIKEETGWGVAKEDTYRGFGDRVKGLGKELRGSLDRLKAEGKRIAAYGATAEGATLLNSFQIGKGHLDFVADPGTSRQGKFMPGSHLPISPPERLLTDRPDYVLLLSWDQAEEVLAHQAHYRGQGGKFITPLPKVRVV